MNKKNIVLIAIISLFLIIQADVILETNGSVQIKRRGRDWQAAQKGMDFNTAESIRTLPHSKASVKLYDNSIIQLDPETILIRHARNRYEVNGLASLKAVNQRQSLRFINGKNHVEIEDGNFTISANSNLLWVVSHDNEFWAQGPDGKLRVLGGYQTIITDEKGPVEPEPNTAQPAQIMTKAKITRPESKIQQARERIFETQAFFLRMSNLRVCNFSVNEAAEIYLNKDDLIRNKVLIEGEISATLAQDITSVMISIDGGETYVEAEGVSPFRYEFQPTPEGKYVVRLRAKDKDGVLSGQTFINIKINFINETDREQIERYMENFANYIRHEQYSGVMAYFNEEKFMGDITRLSENIIEHFYEYDYFYIRYDIRNFITFGKNIEMGIDWEVDVTQTDTGVTSKKSDFTLFKFEKNSENRWRIIDILSGNLFNIPIF
ncbi:MAG: hypothetical protein WC002_07575 [Candidatus Muiribacteriota bacterium]